MKHAGAHIVGVGSLCHPSLIQVNGLGVTEGTQCFAQYAKESFMALATKLTMIKLCAEFVQKMSC
jgi:hypothetical protein